MADQLNLPPLCLRSDLMESDSFLVLKSVNYELSMMITLV